MQFWHRSYFLEKPWIWGRSSQSCPPIHSWIDINSQNQLHRRHGHSPESLPSCRQQRVLWSRPLQPGRLWLHQDDLSKAHQPLRFPNLVQDRRTEQNRRNHVVWNWNLRWVAPGNINFYSVRVACFEVIRKIVGVGDWCWWWWLRWWWSWWSW